MYNPHTMRHYFPVYAVAGGAKLFIGWTADRPHKLLRTPKDLQNFYRTHKPTSSTLEGGVRYVAS